MAWKHWTLVLAATVASAADCTVVAGPRILGSDLKRAVPELEHVDDAMVIGFTPEPGMERRLGPVEARRFGLPAAEGACFRRQSRPLDESSILAAIRRGFGDRQVTVELLDHLLASLPDGQLQFPLSGLARPATASANQPVIWRGQLVYDGNHTLPVWAKVRLAETRQWLEAAAPLKRGEVVRPGQIVLRSRRAVSRLRPGTGRSGRD